jgi:hypothetical protein
LGDAFVEEAELGFKFGEFVLEVEQDAVMEVGKLAVERSQGGSCGCGAVGGRCVRGSQT